MIGNRPSYSIWSNIGIFRCVDFLFLTEIFIWSRPEWYGNDMWNISLRWLLVSCGIFFLFSPSVIRQWYERRKICQNQSKAIKSFPFNFLTWFLPRSSVVVLRVGFFFTKLFYLKVALFKKNEITWWFYTTVFTKESIPTNWMTAYLALFHFAHFEFL